MADGLSHLWDIIHIAHMAQATLTGDGVLPLSSSTLLSTAC